MHLRYSYKVKLLIIYNINIFNVNHVLEVTQYKRKTFLVFQSRRFKIKCKKITSSSTFSLSKTSFLEKQTCFNNNNSKNI